MQSWTFDSQNAEQTLEWAAELGRSIGAKGLAIALIGPLGAGKTVFVKGLALGLGVDPRIVSSPTFVIAQQYPLSEGPETLHHVDLYRLESSLELEAIGLDDMLAAGHVTAVEWADRFPDVLGREVLSIEFEGPSPEEEDAAKEDAPWRGRRARVKAQGEDAQHVLSDWANRVDGQTRSSGGRVGSSPEMRVLMVLLLALGAFVSGRFDRDIERPSCESLVALDSDALGTLRAECVVVGSKASSVPVDGIARLLDGGAIDLNRASAVLLQSLPEIGPVRAAAIARARRDAPFSSVRDIVRVSGIGPRTRSSIERWLFVRQPEPTFGSPESKDPSDG